MPTRKSVKGRKGSSESVRAGSDKSDGYERTIEFVADAIEDDGYEFVQESVSAAFMAAEASSSSSDDEVADKAPKRDLRAVFDLDDIDDPLVGTPAEVRRELDTLALRLQRQPKNQEAFMKIVGYMHKYIMGLVFRKYNFVRGYDEKDIYQEALIAMFKKAVPSFRKGRGMSFLNFAKMCINRHLITILNASRNRRKDQPLNTSISLDHAPVGKDADDDESCALSNILPDKALGRQPFSEMARSESFERTLSALTSQCSEFEKAALMQYLQDKSYREASRSLTKTSGRKCNERSVDNALLRIRKKAQSLKEDMDEDDLPLIFGPVS